MTMRIILISFYLFFSFAVIAQEQTVGVFVNQSDSYNGYSLFSNNRSTYLIDNCGFVVNEWESIFRPGISVYLLENGDLLRAGRGSGSLGGGGAGGIFERYDWDGNKLWSYEMFNDTMQSHHDLEPLPNGNFLALVWVSLTGEQAMALGRDIDLEVWVEKIVEIEMVGSDEANIVWEWNLTDHLIQEINAASSNFGSVSENPGKVNFNYIPPQNGLEVDWIHLNSVDYNPELDQIVVSTRNLNEIWVIDHSTTTEEASTSMGGISGRGGDILYRYGNPQAYNRGGVSDRIFGKQHHVEWILDGPYKGQMTVFNNNFVTNGSRVERWLPPWNGSEYGFLEEGAYGPDKPEWAYSSAGFFSSRLSSIQVLPNQNILICEGASGHFFEIDENGQILWDYINPISAVSGSVAQGETIQSNATFRVIRYSPDYSAFEGRDLTPELPIELDPIDYGCQVEGPNAVYENESSVLIEMTSNLILDHLEVLNTGKDTEVMIVNSLGAKLNSSILRTGSNSIDLSCCPAGLYYLVVGQSTNNVFKFVKS